MDKSSVQSAQNPSQVIYTSRQIDDLKFKHEKQWSPEAGVQILSISTMRGLASLARTDWRGVLLNEFEWHNQWKLAEVGKPMAFLGGISSNLVLIPMNVNKVTKHLASVVNGLMAGVETL